MPTSWFKHFGHQSLLQADTMALLMVVMKHSQITQSNKFVISLQYLKKEVRDEVHFLRADKHKSFYKLALSFLMNIAIYVQSTQRRKLVMFLQYITKKVLQLLLCFYNQIIDGGPVMFLVTCLNLNQHLLVQGQ